MSVQIAPREQVDLLSPYFIDRQAWTDWTPVISQPNNISYSLIYAQYLLLGPLTILTMQVNITGTGVANNAIIISGVPSGARPNMASGSMTVVGTWHMLDGGVAYYSGPLLYTGTDDFRAIRDGSGNYMGFDPTIGITAGDSIGIHAIYKRG